MSLKSVEMQVAIPKTQEASKMQEQMNRQGQQFQEKIAEEQLKEAQLKRERVNKQEQVEKHIVADEKDDEKRRNQKIKVREQNEKVEEIEKIQHPYIGKRIDFTR